MKIDKIFLLFIALFLIYCTFGDWDRYEISNHAIVTLIGVDKKDNKFKLFLEYQPPHGKSNNMSSSTPKKSFMLLGEGGSFVDAENSYLRQSPDDTYMGSIRDLLISDDFAKSGIDEYLNRIRGLREYRKVQDVFTTSVDLKKMFDSEALKIENVGMDIEHLSEQLNIKGIDYSASIGDIEEDISVKNTGFITNHLDLIDNKITNAGYSIFKGDKKIGNIVSDEIKGINYLLIQNASGKFTLDFEGSTVSVEVYLKNKKIKPIYTDGNISFDIKMSFSSHLINTSEVVSIDNNKIKEIGKKTEEKITKDIQDAIEVSQIKFECDYLHLYKYFRSKYNSDFQKMNWNEKYKDAKFNISTSVKIAPANMENFDI